jgi:outer membrane protein OmpA-like peptidoglycan-associated protein
MKSFRFLIIPMALWLAVCWMPWKALADEYDDSQSHPLRVIGYVLHPAGILFEWVIFRPFHALVSANKDHEYVFGHRAHPPLFAEPQPAYDYGVPKRVSLKEAAPPRRAVAGEPVAETVTVKEVTVEKTVLKEVPKIVEVERVVFPDVAFRFDSVELTDLGKGKVYLVAQKLKEKSDIVVVVEGHADYIGSDEYNRRLGLRRAQRVMRELAQLGIDLGRMSAASLGESHPLIDQQTDWARAVNRRVEFRITTP